MHSSALINLNVVHEATRSEAKNIFYSSSACMDPAHNQADPKNPICRDRQLTQLIQILNMAGKII